jgi:CO dehydrogenase nickel-insertion accessory protein CooC1
MKIVITNNKGGQGKTLIATLLTKYLLSNKDNEDTVSGLDLDSTQKNFTDNMSGASLYFFSRLEDIPNDKICVIDTPPNLEKSTAAIRAADILIVPVILGKHAVQGVGRVLEVRQKKDLRLIFNEWDESAIQIQSEQYLINEGFNIAGKLPKYKRLAYNVDAGIDWYAGFSETQIKLVVNILNNLLLEDHSKGM